MFFVFFVFFFNFQFEKKMAGLVDFDQMSNQQKKDYVINNILKGSNFTDPFVTTFDWSTSSMQLHVPYVTVIGFLRTLDFDRICRELVGKKTPQEMFAIVFGSL